ncbi:carbohydrate-binding module family 20 domain-containing protein [Cellulomonas edaphi]|uniref:Alpha-amylase n=1 Tax=Cellulomonas edaphi TaxID=3053468 RepID=A0ABT7S994_9CELL|nr:carbohydrate-binding module family 20 domain-containing protein [Cellulomons edaphi]MDM7832201.1 carbohydrate-binding module family 20 domain-containing protein [Cellulomons edaphi]
MHTTPRSTGARRSALGALLAALLALAGLTALGAANPAAAAPSGPRTTAVNLFQWTWNSIARECTDVLGPAGYGWVQTSPPNEHVRLAGQWWTSYQPVSYKIESKLGTRAEYKAMIDTCRAAGVSVSTDVVINHMSGQTGSGTGWAGTPFSEESYPGPAGGYGPQDFHSCRTNIASYGDRYQVQNCRLVGLQDLDTGSAYVRQEIADYLNDLISLGVRGFRVDAAKHIAATDLAAIKAKISDQSVYIVQEVIGASGEPVQPSEYTGIGDVHEFTYARNLKSVFNGGSLASLQGIASASWLLPSDRAGVFVDNHDTERNGETLSYKDGSSYRLANVFMLAYPYGAPTVYSGYAFSNNDAGAPQQGSGKVDDAVCGQGTWTCAHRWNETAHMAGFRNAVAGTSLTQWWDNGGNQIAFGRGDRGYVALNRAGSVLTRTFTTSLPAGRYCDVISGGVSGSGCSGTAVDVSSSGTATFTVPANGSVALHVGARVGSTTSPTTDPSTGTGTTVYYATTKGWSAYRIHYRVGTGSWTAVPGEAMAAACTGWVSRQVASSGSVVTAAFTDGNGQWDNNGSSNYTLTGAVVSVKDGVVNGTNPCGTGNPTPTPTPTPSPTGTAAQASFGVQATTVVGQNIFVVGSSAELGGWDPARAVALSSATYPVWRAAVALPPGSTVQYKYVRKEANGAVTWESGANRTVTVPASGTLTVTDSWRS